MNIDIRGAVIHNIQDMNPQELKDMVVDSIQRREEKLLPGLGVVFEVIWKNSQPGEQEHMIQTLHSALPNEKAIPPRP
ncbi:small, acid-soluble spore protein I [Polycladomyces abyssicola]|uniref:Small, acid-soluble spore protein I n=1 Tax=Polycladomyces abyssicola TaxID=1125966 RepID=A0A8D5ZM03_9BACL|nr:small acid-soluble spore protein SspI [Polycladomyces abyssicola]BCU81135.1 small, acid-soluble spore protein I [Polycladomyces abyssicola]